MLKEGRHELCLTALDFALQYVRFQTYATLGV